MVKMSEASKEFFKQINEMIRTQKFDDDVIEKLLNMIVVSKILADQESNEEVKKILINISIVGESLAKKLYALKGR
jgi:aspartate/glutamate racemase